MMRFLDSLRSLGMTVGRLGMTVLLLAGCVGETYSVKVSNPLDTDRYPEMVEVAFDEVASAIGLEDGQDFVLLGKSGNEVPCQVTHDGKVVFQVAMKAGEAQTYRFRKGTPQAPQTLACGRHYPGKDDDFAWENDKVGFRIYGHKLDVPAGYDLFAKRGTDRPVLDSLYKNEVYSSQAWARYNELMETDTRKAFRFKMDTLSYHVDHGYGMDCYAVGPTLGAGVAALRHECEILYPYCYETYEILDNGPLRFSVRLTYRPFDVGEDKDVVEIRTITLDAGSHFNRTSVSYSGLSSPKEIVAGIVLQDKDSREVADAGKGFIAYPAPTQNADTTQFVDNGILYVGHAFPEPLEWAGTVYFSDEESKARNNSAGHVLASGMYMPDSEYIYYWGFGWSHADVASYDEWLRHLETFSRMLRNPLVLTIK